MADWKASLTDGEFSGLDFALPDGIVGPGLRLDVIKGPVTVTYRPNGINHQNHTLDMEKM